MLFYALKSSKIRHHSPEVVGSSPASATIKAPDFDTKSGAFLTFWRKMGRSKVPWGIAAGIVPKNAFQKTGNFKLFPVVLLSGFLAFFKEKQGIK